MTQPNKKLPKAKICQQGMAIGLILAAVSLVALIGIALTLGGRAGAMTDDSGRNRILASIIFQQGQNLKMASYATVVKNGGDIGPLYYNFLNMDHTNNHVGIYGPYDGITEPQTPPSDAFTGSPGTWLQGSIQANNLGTGNSGAWTMGVDGLKKGVCQQINKLLMNSLAIPSVNVAVTMSGNYDFRSIPAMNGYYSICFMDSNNTYHYYTTMRAY